MPGWLRWLYNSALAGRKAAWEERSKSVTYFDQSECLPQLRKAELDQLGSVYGNVLEATPSRVDKVFNAFFQPRRDGAKQGFPRFKLTSRLRAIECLRSPTLWARGNGRYVPRIKGLPRVAVEPQREVPTLEPKLVRTTRTDVGINVDLVLDGADEQPLAPSGPAIGIDLGVADQLATREGERVTRVDDSQQRQTIRKRSRAVGRCKKGRRTRSKRVRPLARVHGKRHESKRNARHRASTRLVHRHGALVAADLRINAMTRSPKGTAEATGSNVRHKAGLSRSIPSQSRGLSQGQLACKAERAGRIFEQVDPAYTSRRCHRCAEVEASHRQSKRYACKLCGYSGDADAIAPINILQALNALAVASNLGHDRGTVGKRLSWR